MKTDRYTKVILTLIAVGLFLNLATNLPVQPAFAQLQFPSSITVNLQPPGGGKFSVDLRTPGVFDLGVVDVKHGGQIVVH